MLTLLYSQSVYQITLELLNQVYGVISKHFLVVNKNKYLQDVVDNIIFWSRRKLRQIITTVKSGILSLGCKVKEESE